jgi:uncharacterized membrane protein
VATLVAIAYPDEGTAEEARKTVQRLEGDFLVEADEVAAISRDAKGNYHVTTTHGAASAGGGAARGAFWGFLFGLLFLIPFAGAAIGAGLGALVGHVGEHVIDGRFQDEVRDQLKPGTSALFLILEKVTPDRVTEALSQHGGTVIRTSLSEDATARLQEALHPPATAPSAP